MEYIKHLIFPVSTCTKQGSQRNGFPSLLWKNMTGQAAQSSDLNPIQGLWYSLERRLRCVHGLITQHQQFNLTKALVAEREKIPASGFKIYFF